MKLIPGWLVFALYASLSVAILGFGKAAYNKWHESELERWLSDHDISYPTSADRKNLEVLVKENWGRYVSSPYNDWDIERLQVFLSENNVEVNEKSKENKNWLVEMVKANWYETESAAENAYENVRDWIFDTWTDSQLKNFLDRHGIPNPTPRRRDTLIQAAKEHYQVIAEKLGETAVYPGNWLYEAWSETELKKWLDERGIPVPQPTTRDKLIAHVRRNSRLASLKLKQAQASSAKSAEAAKESVTNAIFNSWSDSKLKQWCDQNGIKVPQGATRNELLALARRHKAYLSDDTISASMSSYYTSATDTIGSVYSKATDATSGTSKAVFDKAIETWSDSRLKAYLDSRGVPIPQSGKRDEVIALVRLHRHKAATGYGAWTFDTWTFQNLRKLVEDETKKYGSKASSATSSVENKASESLSSTASEASGSAASVVDKAATATATTREELIAQVKNIYEQAKLSGGSSYASLTSAMARATDSAKQSTFETWSESELKKYLDSYGIKTYQGSTLNELIADARRAQQLFLYGTTTPSQGMYQRLKNGMGYLYNQFAVTIGFAGKQAERAADSVRESAQYVYDQATEKSEEAKHRAEEKGKYAYDRAYEEGQKAYHKGKEEL